MGFVRKLELPCLTEAVARKKPEAMAPLVALPRGPSLTAKDLIWLVPTAVHLSMVLFRATFVDIAK